jgi:hypothetical protein
MFNLDFFRQLENGIVILSHMAAGKTLKRATLICTGTLRPNSGQNPDKKFPHCYLQSPLQLCIGISISSITRNLLQFLHFSNFIL